MAFPWSEVKKSVKKGLIDAEGKVKRSEFYLTNIDSGEQVQFCMTPESVKARTTANFRSFNVIERGEVKIPKGEQLAQVSWQGVLPGAGMLLYPFLTHAVWERPDEIIKVLIRWREEGAKLRLLITETPLNLDVYIKSFDYTAEGGLGDYKYDIELIAAKELKILTVAEADEARAKAKENATNELNRRAAMKSRTGVIIGQVDGIWEAAQVLLGNGGSWQRLAETNGLKDPTEISAGELIIWG